MTKSSHICACGESISLPTMPNWLARIADAFVEALWWRAGGHLRHCEEAA